MEQFQMIHSFGRPWEWNLDHGATWAALKKRPVHSHQRAGRTCTCTAAGMQSRWLPGIRVVPSHTSTNGEGALHAVLTAEHVGIAESKSSTERMHWFTEWTRQLFCLSWQSQPFLPWPQTRCLHPKSTTIWLVPTKVCNKNNRLSPSKEL